MQFLIAKIRVELPEKHLLGVGIEIHKDSSFVWKFSRGQPLVGAEAAHPSWNNLIERAMRIFKKYRYYVRACARLLRHKFCQPWRFYESLDFLEIENVSSLNWLNVL